MDVSQYWPFACEYSIWIATVTALQFLMTDLKVHILDNGIDWVYTAFFYGDYTQQMWSLPEETLFSCDVATLNDAFETDLAREDKGYESGRESFNIPTPLSRAPRVYHISTMEELSFNSTNFRKSPTSPRASWHHEKHSPWGYRCHSFTHQWLVFTSSDDESPVRAELSSPEHHNLCHHLIPTPNTEWFFTDVDSAAWDDDTASSKENVPTEPLDDEVRSEDPILDRQLCIHETPHEPNHHCSYPSSYSTTTIRIDLPQLTLLHEAVLHYELMDFHDISLDLPDIMITTNNEDIPDLVDVSDLEHLNNIQHRVSFA